MTEKVKLTQEQIQTVRKFMNNDNVLKLSLNELHRVIDGEYEAEKTFEVEDWVVCEDGYIGQIEFINEIEKWANIGYSKDTKERGVCLATTYDLIDIIRHATPEEIAEEKKRRWWNRNNRKTWELHVGDTLISRKNPYSCRIKFVEDVNENSVLLVDGIQDEFYEGVSELEYMRDEYEVFCFKEDRKDSVK